MSNVITYVITIISIIILGGSFVFYILNASKNDEYSNINLKNLTTDSINIDNLNSEIISAKSISVESTIDVNEITSKSISITGSTYETLNATNFRLDKTINTQQFSNFRIIPTSRNVLKGSIYYNLYNFSNLTYEDFNSVNYKTKCDCKASNIFDCNNCVQINNPSYTNTNCNFPLLFGSSPISRNSDEVLDKTNGFLCNGLNTECNSSAKNIFNKNSMYWRCILIFDNKPIYSINPFFLSLYLSNLYYVPYNVASLSDATKFTNYSRVLYSDFVYNVSNYYDFEDPNNGSSYLYGYQDINYGDKNSGADISSKIFTDPLILNYSTYTLDGSNDYLGPQNGCIYSCQSTDPSCGKIYDITDYGDVKSCNCFIPYHSNRSTNTNLLKLDNTVDYTSEVRVLSIYKYIPPSDDVSKFDYIYNPSFSKDTSGIEIIIKHKNYPTNYKSDKKNNFGAMHRNTHSSLSSFKDSNGNNLPCGTGNSTINSFDFGECEITLNYSNKNFTSIPTVEATIQSDIRFQFQGGFGFSCFVSNVTTRFATVIVRNYPMENLKSSSALCGFFLNYKIYT